jgi:hypothetical protein
MYSKEELSEQFKTGIRDPQVLLREYRDLFVFFWLLGAFDEKIVDEEIVSKAEKKHETGNTGVDNDAVRGVRAVPVVCDNNTEQDHSKPESADTAPATGQQCADRVSTGA